MKHRHGDLCFELPDGWLDASQLLFLAPPDSSLKDELLAAAAKSRAPIQLPPVAAKLTANISFSQRSYPFRTPGAEFCERELRAVLGSMPNLKASAYQWGKLGPLEAFTAEVELSADGFAAKQLHALAVARGRVFHFCATSPLGDFERLKPALSRVLHTIEIDGKELES
ncbi:MAG: DcrB-related protein [Myxococcota bacterium]